MLLKPCDIAEPGGIPNLFLSSTLKSCAIDNSFISSQKDFSLDFFSQIHGVFKKILLILIDIFDHRIL